MDEFIRIGPANKYKICPICNQKDIPIIYKKLIKGYLWNSEEVEYRFDHSHDLNYYYIKMGEIHETLDNLVDKLRNLVTTSGYEYFKIKKDIEKKVEENNEKINFYDEIVKKIKEYKNN